MSSFDDLLDSVRRLPPMTDAERALQALDWVYGQLGASTNHKPKREIFRGLWVQRGLPPADFDAWADQREWWS